MDSNLPPGVSASDIPGNGPKDAAWEAFFEWVAADAAQHGMDAAEVREVWNTGMVSWLRTRSYVRRMAAADRATGSEPGTLAILHPRGHGETEYQVQVRKARRYTYDYHSDDQDPMVVEHSARCTCARCGNQHLEDD